MAEEDENLEEMFRGRCSHEQKRRWEQAAKKAQRRLSDWMRLALDAAAESELREKGKRK